MSGSGVGQSKPGRELGPTGETVRHNIRRLRTDARMPLTELSADLGEAGRPIPVLGVRRIEDGTRRVDVDDLVAIAAALGVSPITLLMPVADADETVTATTVGELSAHQLLSWLMAAADRIEARIADAEKLRAALQDIKRLHDEVVVCRGCCSAHCPGDCDWSERYGGELLTVCNHCCIDTFHQGQNEECIDEHEHSSEYGDQAGACATAEIIARCGL